jgi:hypothetical protein
VLHRVDADPSARSRRYHEEINATISFVVTISRALSTHYGASMTIEPDSVLVRWI